MLQAIFLQAGGESLWEMIATWYSHSTLNQIISSIDSRFFRLEFHNYEHIALTPAANGTVKTMIFGIAIGLILAIIFTSFVKKQLGSFVFRLIREECFSKDKAKTLLELGAFRNSTIRRELVRGVNLRKLVRCVEEEEVEDKDAFRMDFTTAHFYLPEELKYRAEIRYEQQGSGWLFVLCAIILTVVFTSLLCTWLPEILQLLDNLISFFVG